MHISNKKLGLIFALFLFFSILLFCYPAGADFSAETMLETGKVVSIRMRSLAAGKDVADWAETNDIKAIRRADKLPSNFVPDISNTVSTPESRDPVYIFFNNENDAGILFLYSEADIITMNPDSSFLVAFNTALTDISGLADLDCSRVVSLQSAFLRDLSLSDISPLSNWNTSSLLYISMMFADNSALKDISAIAKWDTSSVMEMRGLFYNAKSMTDALALRNWDTSNVTDMSYMFSGCTSMLFIDVSNWNTSNVTTMASMFQVGDSWKANGQLIEIIGLGDLDVSNVTDMTCMFYGAGQMTYYDIARWDVSKVESMNHMFCDNRRLRSLDLSAWDVSNLKTIYCMFDDNVMLKSIGDVSHWNTVNLIDAGAWLNDACTFAGDNNGLLDLSGWNTSNLKSAGEMFFYTKIHTIDLSGWTFDSITNELWEGANSGIYYETGNSSEKFKGLGGMFLDSSKLSTVYISQSGLDSYNAAVNAGVNTLDMWTNTKAGGFTVK